MFTQLGRHQGMPRIARYVFGGSLVDVVGARPPDEPHGAFWRAAPSGPRQRSGAWRIDLACAGQSAIPPRRLGIGGQSLAA
jgi:hypothetical protein